MMRVFVAGLGLSLCVGCFTADKTPKKSSLSSQPRAILPAPSNIAEKGMSKPSDFSVAPRNAGPATTNPVSLPPGAIQVTPGNLQLPNNPAVMVPQAVGVSNTTPGIVPVGGLKDPKPPEPPLPTIAPNLNAAPSTIAPPTGTINVVPVIPGG
jgi:hypothetical protein